jgi:hypothetical protein
MASKNLSTHDGSNSLKRFAKCAVAMRNMLHEDAMLSEAEFLFMENHFQVLEMAYFRWKQKQMPHLSTHGAETVRSKAA